MHRAIISLVLVGMLVALQLFQVSSLPPDFFRVGCVNSDAYKRCNLLRVRNARKIMQLKQRTELDDKVSQDYCLVGGVAQWLGRRSLAGGLSLTCA